VALGPVELPAAEHAADGDGPGVGAADPRIGRAGPAEGPSYAVFMVSSMLICIPLAFYYQITSRVVEMTGLPIGQTMSYGQMSEIFFMVVMPFFFARLG
jgi:hypothetical protein